MTRGRRKKYYRDCRNFIAKGECSVLTREDCAGCSFYTIDVNFAKDTVPEPEPHDGFNPTMYEGGTMRIHGIEWAMEAGCQ